MTATQFTQQSRDILDFEALWSAPSLAKELQIRERFGISPTAYYQRLRGLIGTPEATKYAPATVRLVHARLQRGRSRR